ncbi:MAG: diacylglycerol kinase family protein [Bacillota bacterium]
MLKSFACAVKGIIWVAASQRNMKIHLAAAVAVLVAAIRFQINYLEAALVFLAIALVMVAEMVNTAVEKAVDLVTLEYHPLAGRAKDAAAGAVLLAAFFSAVIGLIVFLPYIRKWLAGI